MSDYPRILFVTPHAFNGITGGGITFSNLFRNWPKACLATVHNDPTPTSNDVCDRFYVLDSEELDYAQPFGLLRRRFAVTRDSDIEAAPSTATSTYQSRSMTYAKRLMIGLLGEALPETAFLTPRLEHWIDAYRPNVLYTILGSTGMMDLIEQIRVRFDLPLVVHIMDDWMAASHRRGLLSRWLRPQMHRQVEHLFDVASTRLGISSAMCVAYEDRFGHPFAAFQNTIDTARWQHLAKRKLETGSPAELLYVGSIFANAQLDSLMDCCKAVAALNGKGIAVRLTVVTPQHFAERYESLLRIHPAIRMEIATADDELFFRRIAAADVLLLPVSFDDDSVRTIRYSMPTKVPAYLGCGAPILVYGPAATAQVGYALESGWGHVVARREATALEGGICRVIDDQPLRRRLIARARKSARENHDVTTVRQGFQDLLCSVGHRPDRTREAASA